jgi:hypothetical protein
MPRSNSYNLPVCTTVSSDPIGGLSDSVPGYTATLMRRAIARPLQRLADVLIPAARGMVPERATRGRKIGDHCHREPASARHSPFLAATVGESA